MVNLLFLVLVGLVTSECAVLTRKDEDQEEKYTTQCLQKINTTGDGLSQLMGMRRMLGDQNERCYHKCRLEAFGLINEDGTMDSKKAKTFFKERLPVEIDRVFEIWKTCHGNANQENDICYRSSIMTQCFFIGLHLFQQEQKEHITKIMMECKRETHATEEMVETFFGNREEDPPRELGCLIRCCMEKTGSMLKDGSIDYSKAKTTLAMLVSDHLDETIEILRKCVDRKESMVDRCDYSKKLAVCVKEQIKKLSAKTWLIAIKNCKEKTNATEDARATFVSMRSNLVDSTEGKNFLLCTLKSLGLMNEDGSLDNDQARAIFHQGSFGGSDNVYSAWKSCQATVGSSEDNGDYAFKLYSCFFEKRIDIERELGLNFLRYSQECRKKTNVTDAVYRKHSRQPSSDDPHELKCLVRCEWEKIGAINADGSINPELMRRETFNWNFDRDSLEARNVSEAWKQCDSSNFSKDDSCVYTYELAKCMFFKIDESRKRTGSGPRSN